MSAARMTVENVRVSALGNSSNGPGASGDPPIPLPRARIYLNWHERYHRDPGNVWLRELYLREVRPLYAGR